MAEERLLPVIAGGLYSADQFYNPDPEVTSTLADYGVLGVEMEAAALYTDLLVRDTGTVFRAGADISRITVDDVDAALAAGARAVLVPTPETRRAEVDRAGLLATVAPTLGDAVRIATGAEVDVALRPALLLEQDGTLLGRWLVESAVSD